MGFKKLLFLLLAICSMAFAQGKPKIAVYVATGELNDSERKVIATKILTPFIQSGQYNATERGDAFLSNIAKERQKHKDGSVDDSQISRLGKEAGVQFVCVADLIDAFGIYSLSARLIDVESAEIVGIGETEMKSLGEISNASNEIFRQISGKIQVKQEIRKKVEIAIYEPIPNVPENKSSMYKEFQESQESEYKNFTSGRRWGTWALNAFTLNGIGSWTLMRDVSGGFIHLGFGIVSLFFLLDAESDASDYNDCYYSGYGYSYCDEYLEPDYTLFYVFLVSGAVWNIYRSATYDKPKPKKNYGFADPSNFRLAILPSKKGNGMAYGLRYNYGF
jgi:hypothetical protein